MTARRLVLFDVDGTLLVSAGAGRRAIRAALGDLIGDDTVFDRVRFDGKTDPQIVAELLHEAGREDPCEEERIAEVCRRYVLLLEQELAARRTTVTLMPGVHALLDRLENEAGVVLGLLTGNVERGASLKLQAGGLDPRRFRLGAYGSDSAYRPDLPSIAARRAEPHFGRVPDGDEVVIIGDTPADIACGRGICARAVGVATGSYSVDELATHEPHAVFPDLAATDDVLAALLG
jgi:phosphoglycolate phosphatase-like HAD superfamily hydrolase